MTREKIEEAGGPIGQRASRERDWGYWLKGDVICHTFSPIQLDATDHVYSILLRHALLFLKLLPYRAGRTHVRHRYHH